jgi:hypothetical protein
VSINCAEADGWDESEIGSYTSQASNILGNPPNNCSGKILNYTDKQSIKSIDFSEFIKIFTEVDANAPAPIPIADNIVF